VRIYDSPGVLLNLGRYKSLVSSIFGPGERFFDLLFETFLALGGRSPGLGKLLSFEGQSSNAGDFGQIIDGALPGLGYANRYDASESHSQIDRLLA
jgi:hypothetical protein